MGEVIKPIMLDETGKEIAQALREHLAAMMNINTEQYEEDRTLAEVKDARNIVGREYTSLGLGLRTEFNRLNKFNDENDIRFKELNSRINEIVKMRGNIEEYSRYDIPIYARDILTGSSIAEENLIEWFGKIPTVYVITNGIFAVMVIEGMSWNNIPADYVRDMKGFVLTTLPSKFSPLTKCRFSKELDEVNFYNDFISAGTIVFKPKSSSGSFFTTITWEYPLEYPSIPELYDIRTPLEKIGTGSTELSFKTAGDCVRHYFRNLLDRVNKLEENSKYYEGNYEIIHLAEESGESKFTISVGKEINCYDRLLITFPYSSESDTSYIEQKFVGEVDNSTGEYSSMYPLKGVGPHEIHVVNGYQYILPTNAEVKVTKWKYTSDLKTELDNTIKNIVGTVLSNKKYELQPIALVDVVKDKYYKLVAGNETSQNVQLQKNEVFTEEDKIGHCTFSTKIERGDSIIFTNAHNLTSSTPFLFISEGDGTTSNTYAVAFERIYNHIQSTNQSINLSEYVFETDGIMYISFDYTTAHAGEFFYIKRPSVTSPFVLYSDLAESYLTDTSVGDSLMNAIMSNRQILVRIPNSDGGKHTAIYSPIMTYQLPNYQNNYIYIFYLKDEKQNLDLSAVGLGSIQIPIYGELKIKTSHVYNATPLT